MRLTSRSWNQDGKAYLTHTRLDDRFTLRLCIGQTNTKAEHVTKVWKLIKDQAEQYTI